MIETITDGYDIHFTTDGAWTAEVTEALPAEEAGELGHLRQAYRQCRYEYTITVFVRRNYTGADRKAYIRITCGTAHT